MLTLKAIIPALFGNLLISWYESLFVLSAWFCFLALQIIFACDAEDKDSDKNKDFLKVDETELYDKRSYICTRLRCRRTLST